MADNKDPFAEFGGQALSKEEMDELGFQPETKPAAKPELTAAQKTKEEAGAFGRGLGYGASLGTAPAVEEAASGIGELFKGNLPAVPGTLEFRQKVLERARPYAEAKEKYPLAYGVGEFAGTAATSLPLSAGAARLGAAAAKAVPETMPIARGLTGVGTEAAAEAGIGAVTAAGQGQDKTEGALLGAAGSLGGQLVRKGSEALGKVGQIPAAMKERAIESAPEALRPAAAEMAESPKAFEQYQTAEYELKKPGGLQEQLKTKQTAEEAKFNQLQQDIETANKQKTADYEAALSEEDKAQMKLLKESTKAVRKARTEKAANDLAQAVSQGLESQKQKAAAKYDIAYSNMIDPVEPTKSQVGRLSSNFQQMDDATKMLAGDTANVMSRLISEQADSAATGAYTSGKELKGLVNLDQSLNSDLRRLRYFQQIDFKSDRQNVINNLNLLKQEVTNSLNNVELGIPKEAIDQYKQAKAHYADYAKATDELLEARILATQKVGDRTVIAPTAERSARFLAPKVEDVARTEKALSAFQKLPEGPTPEQFTEMKQMATTMPAGLLPERTRPAMPAPQLQEVPTQRVISPEEAALQGQVDVQRGRAAAFEELARPGDVSKSDWVPGKIGLVQKAVGATPAAKISRAQTVERMFQNPGLSFAVRVLEGQKKVFTLPMVQMLARQYQVDPMELQKALAEQQSP